MKFFDLDSYLQDVILKATKTKARDVSDDFVQINREHYRDIFWQLHNNKELARDEFGKPAAAKQANNLIHQLNNYLLTNRSKLNDVFPIKNPVLIRRPKPPLRQLYSHYLPDIDALDRKLLCNPDFGYPARSVQPGSVQQAEFYLGQLLYTAARFGNLLRIDLLSSLFESLRQTAPVQHHNITWFELSGKAKEQYQWIPDPVSSALLPRYFQLRHDSNWQNDPLVLNLRWLTCIRYFLRKSRCKSVASLRKKKLLSTLKSRLSITHTPCHLNVATGEEPNMSLTKSGFTRLVGYYNPIRVNEDEVKNEDKVDDIKLAPSTSAQQALAQHQDKHLDRAITDCKVAIKLVKQALSDYHSHSQHTSEKITDVIVTKSLRELSQSLLAIAANPNFVLLPVTRLLIEWAAMRLVSQNKWSGKLKPKSIVTYLSHIFIPMADTFAGHDIIQKLSKQALLNQQPWDIADLDEYYLEIIDEGPSKNSQLMRAKILRDFHLFLEKVYNIEPSYVCSTIVMQGGKIKPSMVDANILLPYEYQQACEILLKRAKLSLEPASDYIPLILLVLGFRCGLRRREALFLRASDMQTPGVTNVSISPLTELLVRPFEQRQLKSKAAERRLPLGKLLNESEIEWLNEFFTLRQQSEPSLYVFCTNSPGKPADADTVFRPLVEQLKLITQDAAFRYHRLRHSFVTWTFWYWQQHKYQNTHPLKPLLQHDVMLHLEKARQHYFNQAPDNAIRGELHAISVMAGHSSPSMTLLHYLHSLHWCQSAEAWRHYSLDQDAIAKLLGLHRRTFFDQKDKHGLIVMLQQAISPWCSSLPVNSSPEADADIAAIQTAVKTDANDVHDFYQVLYKFYITTQLFKAPTSEENENDDYYINDENMTPDSLLKHPTQQHQWAEQHFVNPGQFINAVNSLKTRLVRTNRALRQQKNKFTGSTYTSKIIRYELPRWSGKGYASKTAKLIIQAFNTLQEEEQNAVLNIAHYIVMDRVISWNNCQFRHPDDLWRFVLQIAPLMKRLPARYYINIDLLHKAPLDSSDRADFYSTWQKPADFSITPKINHIVYSDTKGKGYAALTLRATTSHNSDNRQGDHGLYIGMSAIYFYFNSLEKPIAVSHKDLKQAEPTQNIVQEPSRPNGDDLLTLTDDMLLSSMGISIDDLDNVIPNGIESTYADIESYVGDDINDSHNRDVDELPAYDQKPKGPRKKP
ncbi:site-specific integrase [Rheinheimera oceanensis]|uniref:site-specific integrase n=1 Tax=Rheinheimera oceanensis TaxID=2817449 RepID=UPI001BFED560|nr:site-specific integrase [Rheinheimera oceanensis]